jgi:hypothetical protein
MPISTTDNVTVLCILIYMFLDRKLEYKIFCTEQQQTFPQFNLHIISSSTLFSFFYCHFQLLYLKTLVKEVLILVAHRCCVVMVQCNINSLEIWIINNVHYTLLHLVLIEQCCQELSLIAPEVLNGI